MMEQPINIENMEARFEVIRHSEYFPAVLGAVAGGVTGALMSALISGSKRQAAPSAKADKSVAATKSSILLGFSPREIIQLTTIVTSLIQQLKQWRAEG